MNKVLSSKYFLWLVLALPSLGVFSDFSYIHNGEEEFGEIMHSTGELSVRLLVLTLYLSPLLMFFKRSKILKYLRKNRRYIGVAAFAYGLIHLVAYLIYKNYDQVVGDLTVLRYFVGWLGFIILLPLAITSFNQMVKRLGSKKWKALHRLVYLASLLIALHWLLAQHDGSEGLNYGPVIVHFGPLFILELYRYYRHRYYLYRSASLKK